MVRVASRVIALQPALSPVAATASSCESWMSSQIWSVQHRGGLPRGRRQEGGADDDRMSMPCNPQHSLSRSFTGLCDMQCCNPQHSLSMSFTGLCDMQCCNPQQSYIIALIQKHLVTHLNVFNPVNLSMSVVTVVSLSSLMLRTLSDLGSHTG